MNFSSSFFQTPAVRRWGRPGLLWLCCLLTAVSALAVTPGESGPSLTARAASHHGRFFVSGLLTGVLPGHQHAGSHVEVEVINARGQVIATASDRIGRPTAHPRSTRWGRERFVVSFPETLGRQAARVRVSFHNHPHSSCPGDC